MSVLIKGMEMPKRCWDCDFCKPGGDLFSTEFCKLTGKIAKTDTISQNCPLVPVPEHGRLIDADALLDSDGDVWDGMWGYSGVQIANAPTIIPADPAEEGET